VSFVSESRWPNHKPLPHDEAWNVVPDLVAEVLGPDDLAETLELKTRQYLESGVGIVWLVWPIFREVHVRTAAREVLVLTHNQTLDGGPVLPGFRLPLAELFPEPVAS
jgi:Uma2 family endonuclease